ncbi:hypothetical protein HII13_003739 [Brettanomyces bruxellensis]|nr:hypothetical protein HII13_003739 [Brettanomyces bruxellensis]
MPAGGASIRKTGTTEVITERLQGSDYDGASSRSSAGSIGKEQKTYINGLPKYDLTVSSEEQHVKVGDYHEKVITVKDYFKNVSSHPGKKAKRYVKSLFPIAGWIAHYPFMPSWIYSDFVAGLTVGIVLVPQGMSYAQLAGLSPEYGLYSSFIGLLMYSIFATSKDVSIGPVAVMSMEVGKIITRMQSKYGDKYTGPEIATTLALLCGAITFAIGVLRLGFIVELIPLPAVLAFMGGSAFSIIVGQVPGLMGFNKHVNTREAAYKVVINTLKNLHRTKVDAAFGLVCLFILYAWRYLAARLYRRYPKNKFYFYLQHVRAAIVIIFATLISYLVIRHRPTTEKTPFSVIGKIHSGLQDVEMFHPPAGLAADLASNLPVATIVLVLEHISIAKSFGLINDYKINPNQEFIAIGVTNLVGTFFHSYPATGSFSRTALKSKCGVKTPFSGMFGGACVLLAIYCFTSAFYYIPKAALCAIIIHAVSDLIPSYKVTLNLFRVAPIDGAIFVIGIFLAVFTAIENGIYFCMAAAAAHILWRLCITNGSVLGRIKVVSTVNPVIKSGDAASSPQAGSKQLVSHFEWVPLPHTAGNPSKVHTRYVNNAVDVVPPPPGVVVYRLSESFIYPNSSRQADAILDEVKRVTRNGKANKEPTWNHPGPLVVRNPFKGSLKAIGKFAARASRRTSSSQDGNEAEIEENKRQDGLENDDPRPRLRVLHLDFSQVVGIDATSIQALIDLKKAVQTYCNCEYEIHFSGIINPWVIRALVNAGFGGSKVSSFRRASGDIESAAGSAGHAGANDDEPDTDDPLSIVTVDNRPQTDSNHIDYLDTGVKYDRLVALYDTDHPHFHFNIPSYSEFE